MPDVHIPHVHDRGILKLLLEVALISVGVFLGLMGEQWREHRLHRELAENALRRFRTEIGANRKSVAAVVDYHQATAKNLHVYLAADTEGRKSIPLKIAGVRPAFVERTAWELALATQSLAYIDSDLAYELSQIYTTQQVPNGLTSGLTQTMYLRAGREAFFSALDYYYGDTQVFEPKLLEMYDAILPRIDKALE